MATLDREDIVPNLQVKILKLSAETWDFTQETLLGSQITSSLPEKCYVFLDGKPYANSESVRRNLLRHFDVPGFLCNETCTKLNGYFGCKGTYNKEEEPKIYSTWFRCLVKRIPKVIQGTGSGKPEKDLAGKPYKWYEMGFITEWDKSGKCRVLCIDTPEELQSGLKAVLKNKSAPLNFEDPLAMHIPLIDQIILLYDDSVWRFREPLRSIEKERDTAEADFGELHDLSRHSIHVSEILSVTTETLERFQGQQRAIYSSLAAVLTKPYRQQAEEYTSFQLQMVKAIKLRSISNTKRLKNEITLAFNMIARQDNTVMKSIAILTMTVLPATFLSAFFSMTFFTYGDGGWQGSKQIWIYWIITIPLTILVLAIWSLSLHGPFQRVFTVSWWKKFFKRIGTAKPKENGLAV